MNKIFNLFTAVMLVAAIGVLSACKKDFDQPPAAQDLPIVANTTIQTLKALHTVPGQMDPITSDIIISGVVTANDRSGNLYKEMYIQDSTGAIKVLLDATGLFGTYPVGRRVYIYTKGLWISDDNGVMILGTRVDVAGVPSLRGIIGSQIANYVKGGSINNPVVPKVVTINELTTNMQDPNIGRLIQLQGWEFTPRDTSKTYGDTSVYKADRNDTIQDCNSAKTIIRSSAFSNFAAVNVPNGNGNVTAIYAPFRTTKQFIIRDTSDVQFYGPRCGAIPTGATLLFEENFEGLTVPTTAPYPVIALSGWTNASQAGNKFWDARSFGGNKYAYMSAFGSAQSSVISWLVTPGIALDATINEVLQFKTMQGFISSGGTDVRSALKVLVSTDYTGTGNPWAAGVNWTDITSQVELSPGNPTGSFPDTFTASGNVDLNSYTGTIYVAFRYEGADPTGTTNDKTSAWEVDDIRVYGF